jgi:hypothetical protein
LYLSDISLPEGANGDSIINIFKTGVCVSECPAANGAIKCSDSEQARCDSFDVNTRYETILVGPYCFPKDLGAINGNQLNGWNAIIDKIRSSNAGQFIMDLHNTATSVYICLGLAFVLSIFYIYMMSFAANCMSKIAILIIELCVIAGIALTFFHAHAEVNGQKGYIIAGIALSCFWLVFNCLLWCYWTQLKVAIAVLDATADFMASTKRMFFVSVFGWVLILVTVLVWAAGVACVVSLNDITAKGIDYPQIKTFDWNPQNAWMLIFMCCGAVWFVFFLSDTTSFIAMVSASTFYFTSNAEKNGGASVCMGFRLAYTKHAGTIAFGSLVNTIVTLVRFIVEAICDQTERASENVLARILVCLARYCMRCLESCIEFVNRDAYAYCAITGDSYCKSAWNGFILNLKYNARYTFAQMIAWMFIGLGKIMICLINCGTYYILIKYVFETDKAIHNIWGPIIVLAISTFITTQMFLGLFDEATLATLMSLAVDLDLNSDRNDNQPKYGPPSFHKKMAKIFEFKDYKQITVTQEIQQQEVIATTAPGKRNEMV